MTHRDYVRTIRLKPYRSSTEPTFTLRIFDTGRSDRDGKSILGYELKQHIAEARLGKIVKETVMIFEGNDFHCSLLHAIDSDDTVKSLMGFLCLRHGDTDSEYFENYTAIQSQFSEQHAEALEMEIYYRFGEDN